MKPWLAELEGQSDNQAGRTVRFREKSHRGLTQWPRTCRILFSKTSFSCMSINPEYWLHARINDPISIWPMNLFSGSLLLWTQSLTPRHRESHCILSLLTSVYPRGDHISSELLCVRLTPAWNTIFAKRSCEICYLWIFGHAKLIGEPSGDRGGIWL